MTEPVVEETREFYDSRPSFETRPEDDPPMTVRVQDWARRFDSDVPRVIRLAEDAAWPRAPWYQVSGRIGISDYHGHGEVASWPVVPALTYTTAFRHTENHRRLEEAARGNQGALEGDMGEEAFRGAPD